ncbi:MAG TPA: YdcF family protein [Bellilinea sp.]|nr:YdcF family protein [Bellilinea sp.]
MSNQTNKSPIGCFQKLVNSTLLFIAGSYLVLVVIGLLLVSSDVTRKADAIVLLSGGGKTRNAAAVALFKDSAAETIVLTQTSGPGSLSTMTETRSQLMKGGVPSYMIQTAYGTATSTFDEARQVAKLAKSAGFKSVLIVTDPYHSLRARILFAGELGTEGVKVRVVAATDHWYKPISWMFSREGWRVTATELVKIGAIIFGMRGG